MKRTWKEYVRKLLSKDRKYFIFYNYDHNYDYNLFLNKFSKTALKNYSVYACKDPPKTK